MVRQQQNDFETTFAIDPYAQSQQFHQQHVTIIAPPAATTPGRQFDRGGSRAIPAVPG